MWTVENRLRYNRDRLRYPSDLTDDEWALIAPLIPPARRGGRRRSVDSREVLNGLLYVLSTGCQWRYVPKDFPPKTTLFGYFDLWTHRGVIDRIHHALYLRCRDRVEREASPSACIIDSQREGCRKRGACIDPNGYDAGKKIKGKKRHVLVDTEGLLMHAIVHPADIQDRDGGVLLISTLFGLYPFLGKLFADGGYQGRVFERGVARFLTRTEVEIVKRSDTAKGFVVLARRWVVERTFAWLNRCRRLAKDFENRTRNALAFLKLASIRLMDPKTLQSLRKFPNGLSGLWRVRAEPGLSYLTSRCLEPDRFRVPGIRRVRDIAYTGKRS